MCARVASPTHGHARRSACVPSAHDCAPRTKATRLARRAVLRFFCFSRVDHSRIRRILDGRHDAAVGGDGRGRSTLAKPAGRSRWTSGMPARTMGGQTRGEPWRGSALEPGGSWHPAHLVLIRRRCSLTVTAARLMRAGLRGHVRRGRARPGHETGCMDTRVCAAVYRGAVRRVKPEG